MFNMSYDTNIVIYVKIKFKYQISNYLVIIIFVLVKMSILSVLLGKWMR